MSNCKKGCCSEIERQNVKCVVCSRTASWLEFSTLRKNSKGYYGRCNSCIDKIIRNQTQGVDSHVRRIKL